MSRRNRQHGNQDERQRHSQDTAACAAASPSPDRDTLPPWLPVGSRWNDLPQEIRQAVSRILVPAYRQLVLDAPDELQRSTGLTLVHLLWLELCNQIHMVDVVADPTSFAATMNNPEKMIDQHLNLVAAKSQTAELLVKLRLVNEALARSAVPVNTPLASSAVPLNTPLARFGRGAGGEGCSANNPEITLELPKDDATPGPTPSSELEKPPSVDQQIPNSPNHQFPTPVRELEEPLSVDQHTHYNPDADPYPALAKLFTLSKDDSHV